ncbi:hypothetical protein SISSUDRAFT_1067243 [Sistotremastrum suecicum HHB10207 ss-3]|uniref:Uncharacterized protein n=1 Tax=Sistotremastrum suecicum HHB10207 ss-3 TaxID=1314776 RepID=A0A165XBZ0_9AGAM|nr:hypothetical protein SISSUDRAFT_1067243 [Sistotremastrum suecicum HHB10207 ss-3]
MFYLDHCDLSAISDKAAMLRFLNLCADSSSSEATAPESRTSEVTRLQALAKIRLLRSEGLVPNIEESTSSSSEGYGLVELFTPYRSRERGVVDLESG